MIITTIHAIESIPSFAKAGIDAVVVSIPYFSIRNSNLVALEELPVWKKACKDNGILLYVNFLRFCMESDMKAMKEAMLALKEADVDGIYYADEGVLYEAIELDIADRMIYQPETLVTSHYDVDFYLDQGVQSVSLAHELSLDEILAIAKHTPNIEVLIHGFFSIMYSRRPLISNYLEVVDQEDQFQMNHRYDLIEQTRTERLPIVQDESGTHVFSAMPIQSFAEINKLAQAGISRFRIDAIFSDDKTTIKLASLYQKALAGELIDEEMNASNHLYHQETIKKKEEQ